MDLGNGFWDIVVCLIEIVMISVSRDLLFCVKTFIGYQACTSSSWWQSQACPALP